MITDDVVGLRAIDNADLHYLLRWRNNPEFRKHFREYRELAGPQQAEWYQNILKDPHSIIFSIVLLADGNRLIGACGLTYINWVVRHAEISLYIGHNSLYLDEMYAPRAWKLLMTYGFNTIGMNKLWVEAYEFDGRRIALCEKFGFHLDGVLRDNAYYDGQWANSHIYSLLAAEYGNSPPETN